MYAVSQLPIGAATPLAEVSGAPRPLIPPPERPNVAAKVITLRPATDPAGTGTVATAAVETTTLSNPARSDGASVKRLPGTPPPPSANEDSPQRISGIARSVAQGALEVLAGTMPLQQMARWLDSDNYERLQLRANLVRCIGAHGPRRSQATTSAHRNVIVRSARVCSVGPGVYEASVVAFDQKRVRAVALRIEQRRGAWRVTALEIG